ncbi:MAG: oxidoreductase [Betaproteobacteria bacterium]|nr:oxidoreductase [Betaproteobacteria bacterium]MDE2212295.1 oxidoreductase [Betaproteobacteria bacterium]MDE2354757.1 oxidoreductase [Betaproteobacteria bacterium]
MPFKAYRVDAVDGRVSGKIVTLELSDLPPGDVLIRAEYSSVNYKDALAATGMGKIMRRMPLTGGIDVAGTVEGSTDARFRAGDQVLVTGYDLGVAHDGGYARYVRVPADWVVKRPEGLDARQAMALGTAGFTAALSVVRLEQNGLKPENGPVVVTGATGGVGSMALEFLAGLGYAVTAVTGKADRADYLRGLGARDVLLRGDIDFGSRPLEKALWAGAVDPVGGAMLAWLTRTMQPHGSIASSGLTGGIELNTTVMPFILRGINLLGIDSVTCPMPLRLEVWRRLATDLRPRHWDDLVHEITLEGLDAVFGRLMKGEGLGRTVVRLMD